MVLLEGGLWAWARVAGEGGFSLPNSRAFLLLLSSISFTVRKKRELGWVGEKGYRGCVKENLSGQTFLTSNLFPGGMNPASSTVSCCELVS